MRQRLRADLLAGAGRSPSGAFVHDDRRTARSSRDGARLGRELFRVGEQVLTEAADAAGDRGDALRQRAEALWRYRMARGDARKEWIG